MGSVYLRGKKSKNYCLAYVTAGGRRRCVSSGTEDREEAEKMLAQIERAEEARRAAGLLDDTPPTVTEYAERTWIPMRTKYEVRTVNDETTRLRLYVLPLIGRIRLGDVTTKDIRDVVETFEKKDPTPAPLYVHRVYEAMSGLFRDAAIAGLIPITPCTLSSKRGRGLPEKNFKDPVAQANASYSKDEAEILISEPRIPEWRRVVYAESFILGPRAGETVGLTFDDYDSTAEPLGRIIVTAAYNNKLKRMQVGGKTGVTKHLPVHPTLARILAEWKLRGFEKYTGRRPTGQDLIVPRLKPSRLTGLYHLNTGQLNDLLHQDLEMLGMRRRKLHDMRATFISMALADGANKDILKWMTHPPKTRHSSAMDGYVRISWQVLCAEVLKLKINTRNGQLLLLPVPGAQ
jgi:integrase